MRMQIQNKAILLLGLLLVCHCAQAQNDYSSKKGFLAETPKKMLIELKAGRGFLSSKPSEGTEYTKVFYGGANLSFGFLLRTNFLGLGVGGEYVDVMDGAFDFPIFLNYQHYFSKDMEQGFFVGGKAGYAIGLKKSIEDVFEVYGNPEPGIINRSMQGFYGEVCAGYRIRGINLFVAYNYRVIGYKTVLDNPAYESPYETYSRDLHVVMAGVSFMPF